jgi:hypothetical protein
MKACPLSSPQMICSAAESSALGAPNETSSPGRLEPWRSWQTSFGGSGATAVRRVHRGQRVWAVAVRPVGDCRAISISTAAPLSRWSIGDLTMPLSRRPIGVRRRKPFQALEISNDGKPHSASAICAMLISRRKPFQISIVHNDGALRPVFESLQSRRPLSLVDFSTESNRRRVPGIEGA